MEVDFQAARGQPKNEAGFACHLKTCPQVKKPIYVLTQVVKNSVHLNIFPPSWSAVVSGRFVQPGGVPTHRRPFPFSTICHVNFIFNYKMH